ncbi:MAG: nucleotide exchange factor GrpE [Tissierellia bacterium]|nr:nucleotide exchange factor GrpE [Tissierellia bacterium]
MENQNREKVENLDPTMDPQEPEIPETEEPIEEQVEQTSQAMAVELEEMKSALVRLQADFNNYRNRVDKEKTAMVQYATESLVIKLLSVLDNFDRAQLSCEENPGLMDGVAMIKQELLGILAGEGLTEIASDGAIFDPNYHHAVVMEDSDLPSGTVIETLQKGYTMRDKVIRPSMVKVAK